MKAITHNYLKFCMLTHGCPLKAFGLQPINLSSYELVLDEKLKNCLFGRGSVEEYQ